MPTVKGVGRSLAYQKAARSVAGLHRNMSWIITLQCILQKLCVPLGFKSFFESVGCAHLHRLWLEPSSIHIIWVTEHPVSKEYVPDGAAWHREISPFPYAPSVSEVAMAIMAITPANAVLTPLRLAANERSRRLRRRLRNGAIIIDQYFPPPLKHSFNGRKSLPDEEVSWSLFTVRLIKLSRGVGLSRLHERWTKWEGWCASSCNAARRLLPVCWMGFFFSPAH